MKDIVVVGTSLAGVRSAEAARRAGHDGRITLVGAEPHFPPIDRPPLSKDFLLSPGAPAAIRVQPDLDPTVRPGRTATALDVGNRRVLLDSGERLPYDGLVIATGATPRTLPQLAGMSNVHVLRGVDDAGRLKASLRPGRHVAVIGAGVLGCEIAASCAKLSLRVTVIEPCPAPMLRVVGPALAPRIAALHRQHGVDLRLGRTLVAAHGDKRIEHLVLDGDETLGVDVIVVAIGATPETAWLRGSGLDVGDGVLCDDTCFAVGGEGRIVAAGDVARSRHPLLGRDLRVEHWTNAVVQGQIAGRNLVRALNGTGEPEPHAALPYFWSDQYDWKIQLVGVLGEDVSFVEDQEKPQRTVATFHTGDRLVGALLVNAPAQLHRWRTEIGRQAVAA